MLKHLALAIIFGSIAVFSYAPFHIWPLAFISFAGLLWLIANKSKKQAMLIGLCWGIGYFTAGVHWIYISIKQYGELPSSVALIILGFLILYLSLYPMLFALLLSCLKRFAPPFSLKQQVFAAPIFWQLTEFLRGYILTGFSWLELGYSQLDSPLRAYFPLIGINGVTLLTTILCGLITYCLFRLKQKAFTKHFFGALIALFTISIAPLLFNQINWTKVDNHRVANFALIQGNIAQSLRWTHQQLNQTIDTYTKLTKANFGR